MVGKCEGTFYQARIQLGQLHWTQGVGKASSSSNTPYGIVGMNLQFLNNDQNPQNSILHQWNLLHPSFGFVPRNDFAVTQNFEHRYAHMYAGLPLDFTKFCRSAPLRFPVQATSRHGAWMSGNIMLYLNGNFVKNISVIWDTGCSFSHPAPGFNFEFPSHKYSVEISNGGPDRIGAIFSAWNPLFDMQSIFDSFILGMNFMSNFVIHFEYGKDPAVTICFKNGNYVYDH
jgi:hypothetical protein